MPRWRILRSLLNKEALRHLNNRGGIVMVLLLLVAAMLLSFFGRKDGGGGLMPSVRVCYVDFAEDGPHVRHLRRSVPPELAGRVEFRHLASSRPNGEPLRYATDVGAIQLRPPAVPGGPPKVWVWYPSTDSAGMAAFETWYWKESYRFERSLRDPSALDAVTFEDERSSLSGGFDLRSEVATSLVVFALFFVCVYLLPSLTCEEREKGVLLAQALSPASTAELLLARFLFYPAIGLVLAAALAATYEPRVLTRPFFWMALVSYVMGSMGIGLTIASLARSQREASLGAMSYVMAVALILFICQQNGIRGLPSVALEYHGPRMIRAALTDTVQWYHWLNLAASTFLASVWAVTAGVLFRRRGWQ